MTEDDDADTNQKAMITAEGSVNITDLLGIGAIAKSPAALKVVSEILTVLTAPTRTYLKGRAEAKVEAKRRVEMAKADQEVAQIQAETNLLVERMGQRFIAEQVIKQTNMEKTLSVAVSELNERVNDEPRDLDRTWLLRWMGGAQAAGSAEVQYLWAKILASKSSASTEDVSHSALALLEHLDGDTARAMQDVVEFRMVYGAVPWHSDTIKPPSFNVKLITLLIEIGVLEKRNANTFAFKDFDLDLTTSNLGLAYPHGTLDFTQRGYELAHAIFESDQFFNSIRPKYDLDTRVEMLRYFVREAIKQSGNKKALLRFKNDAGTRTAELRVMEGSTLVDRSADQLMQDIKSLGVQLSDTAVKLIAVLKVDYRNAGVTPIT